MSEEAPVVAGATKQAIVYQFVGDGSEYHTGIPARNLTANDVALLDEERALVLSASPLYEKAAAPRKVRKDGE